MVIAPGVTTRPGGTIHEFCPKPAKADGGGGVRFADRIGRHRPGPAQIGQAGPTQSPGHQAVRGTEASCQPPSSVQLRVSWAGLP